MASIVIGRYRSTGVCKKVYQKTVSLALFLVMSVWMAPLRAEQEPINIGLEIHLPHFMWISKNPDIESAKLDEEKRKKWRYAEANLNKLSNLGAGWNIVVVRQWKDSPDDLLRVKRVVEQHRARGVKVVFRLLEEPGVYQRLTQTEDSVYGYDRDYYQWVNLLAKTFGNDVDYFLISNECEIDIARGHRWDNPGAPEHFTINFDQYAKLSKTATKAIHAVSPTIKTANCGFSDRSVALAVTDSIMRKEGIDAAMAYWKSWLEVGPVKVLHSAGLVKLLADPVERRKIDFVTQAVHDPAGTQLLQVHYYGGWRGLPRTIRWLQDEMLAANSARPIIAAEVGYALRMGKDSNTALKMQSYSVTDHASSLVKNLALFLRSGTNMALYWGMRGTDHDNLALRLFSATDNPDQFDETAATVAFRTFASFMSGGRLAAPRLPASSNLWELHITGREDLSLVWGDNIDPPMNLPAGTKLLNIAGQNLSAADRLNIRNGEPFYIIWPAVAAQTAAATTAQRIGGLPTQTNLLNLLLKKIRADRQLNATVLKQPALAASKNAQRP